MSHCQRAPRRLLSRPPPSLEAKDNDTRKTHGPPPTRAPANAKPLHRQCRHPLPAGDTMERLVAHLRRVLQCANIDTLTGPFLQLQRLHCRAERAPWGRPSRGHPEGEEGHRWHRSLPGDSSAFRPPPGAATVRLAGFAEFQACCIESLTASRPLPQAESQDKGSRCPSSRHQAGHDGSANREPEGLHDSPLHGRYAQLKEDPLTMLALNVCARLLCDSKRPVALTGAGMSAESGIPTFRDSDSGMWARWFPGDAGFASRIPR